MNPTRNRSTIIYVLLFAAIIILVVYNFNQNATTQEVLTINEVAAAIQSNEVDRIVANDDRLTVIYGEGEGAIERIATKEANSTLVDQLLALGVTPQQLSPENIMIEINPPSAWLGVATAIGYILPFAFLGFVFWFIFRQAQGSNNAAMSFGKSRARMFTGDQPSVTFADVAGVEEAKEELREVVEFLREPEKFITLGARIPKGCSAGWPARHRENPAGQSCLWGGRGAFLLYLRLRICGNVRWRRRQPGARPVRPGQAPFTLHCLRR